MAPSAPTVAPSVTPTRSPLEDALYTGDASNVSIQELRTEFDSLAGAAASTVAIVSDILWGQPAEDLSLTWDPTHDSVQLRMGDSVHKAPLITSNYNYKSPTSTSTSILAIAGDTLAGQGGRMAAFGGNPLANLWANNQNSAGFDTAMVNVVRWLLGEDGPATATAALTPRIVTAHLPGSSSFWCVTIPNHWFEEAVALFVVM
jgi:hypothetical protein